ncbi:SGNH/GDSL hydrolase family protein [Amaricoccus sp.]|uniref:SGNH/GDSL hydrolase family protein n=1 Tax=Amaricoccus sp. TaxID=1872485 RepID=UPI001B3CC808|nr:SGNH/GDSL hydrolase family protein [Amaricoccus sp.]MBP7241471.1 SGNH/GDSL hydrolase family protein [Amaricoccus sp.]
MTRMLNGLVLASIVAFAMAAPAAASTVRFGRIHVMGDSLSDVGNTRALTQGAVPVSPPYNPLRFSNGNIWYDHVAAAVRADGGRARTFAYGNAKAIGDRDLRPDLLAQRGMLLDQVSARPTDLGVVWMGINDLLPRVGRDNIRNVAHSAADRVFDTAKVLQRNGFNSVMLFNMPNLADLPRYAGAGAATRNSARNGSVAYNDRLSTRIDQLRGRGMEVVEVDVFGLFGDVFANPSSYGIENLTTPCIRSGRDRCTTAQARVTAFADRIHPSAALHRILADHVIDLLAPPPALMALLDGARPTSPVVAASASPVVAAPVPLPAPALLLLGGLGALGLAARRRTNRRTFPSASENAM